MEIINAGASDNDPTADEVRTAFQKCIANFSELDTGKAPLASPTFTGTPLAPTATGGTANTQIATTAFVMAALSALLNGADASHDTLKELQDLLVADESGVAALTTLVGQKLVKSANLSDLTDASAARGNLGVAIGTNVQAYSAVLALYAAINPSANIQSLLGAADYGAVRTQLGLVIGTDVEAHAANLTAIGALTSAANKLTYFTGSGTAALADLTSFARTLLAGADGPAVARLLGSPYVIGKSAVAVPLTGTTAETTLATITVPGNALGANGQIEIEALFSFTNNANTKTPRFKFGSLTFQSTALTSTAGQQIAGRVANRNATNSQVSFAGSGTGFGSSTSNIPVTSAIDTTANVDITITGQLATSTDTMTLESYIVRVSPS